jgi:hypothetical protein
MTRMSVSRSVSQLSIALQLDAGTLVLMRAFRRHSVRCQVPGPNENCRFESDALVQFHTLWRVVPLGRRGDQFLCALSARQTVIYEHRQAA